MKIVASVGSKLTAYHASPRSPPLCRKSQTASVQTATEATATDDVIPQRSARASRHAAAATAAAVSARRSPRRIASTSPPLRPIGFVERRSAAAAALFHRAHAPPRLTIHIPSLAAPPPSAKFAVQQRPRPRHCMAAATMAAQQRRQRGDAARRRSRLGRRRQPWRAR